MVTVYLNVYVVGRLLFISASLVKPDGCVRFVQFSLVFLEACISVACLVFINVIFMNPCIVV